VILYKRTPTSESMKATAFDIVTWTIPTLYLAARLEALVGRTFASCFFVLLALTYCAYVIGMTARFGGTVGDIVAGVRIVRVEGGGHPGVRQAAVRFAAQLLEGALLVCTGPIGFGLLLWRRRKYRGWWHDWKAGTTIVLAPQR